MASPCWRAVDEALQRPAFATMSIPRVGSSRISTRGFACKRAADDHFLGCRRRASRLPVGRAVRMCRPSREPPRRSLGLATG